MKIDVLSFVDRRTLRLAEPTTAGRIAKGQNVAVDYIRSFWGEGSNAELDAVTPNGCSFL